MGASVGATLLSSGLICSGDPRLQYYRKHMDLPVKNFGSSFCRLANRSWEAGREGQGHFSCHLSPELLGTWWASRELAPALWVTIWKHVAQRPDVPMKCFLVAPQAGFKLNRLG